MLDHLCYRIQFDSSHVIIDSEGKYGLVDCDFHDLEIPLASRSVYRDENGVVHSHVLHHPYETLPTHFTGMAFKVYLDSSHYPHIELKYSPAKILQGHNVFGSDDIESGFFEGLGYLYEAYPLLASMLYIPSAEISHIDVTYSCRTRDQQTAYKVLDYLSRVSNGQTRISKKRFDSSVYWGGQTSRLINHKCYLKHDEFISQLSDYKQLALKNDKAAQRVVDVMQDQRLIDWTIGLLRFESRFKKRWLERHEIPTNVFELIKFQRANPNLLKSMWLKGTKSLFDALKGQTMKLTDDDSVFNALCQKHFTITKSGKKSFTKARNLFMFYNTLREQGCEAMRKAYSDSRYYQNIADLIAAGFSKSYLQNLQNDNKNNVIPFIKLVEIDFNQQLPDWYQEPVSQFNFKIA